MAIIRVLLAVPPALRRTLGDVGSDDIRVEITGVDPLQILLDAARTGADIVVIELNPESDAAPNDPAPNDPAPGIASHLLAEHPHIKVLAITGPASHAVLYELHPRMVPIGAIPPGGLPAALRTVFSTEGA
jgi:hypothetical protein